MSKNYTIEHVNGITRIQFSKNPEYNEVQTVIDDIAENFPYVKRLWDFSNIKFDLSVDEIKAIAEILKTYPKAIEKVYEEGASSAVKEIGALATDIGKAFRLVTAPIQYLGSMQDRLAVHLRKLSSEIPKENQVTPPSSMLLPLLEKLKYQGDEELLTELYLELLKRACDKNRVSEAHPAFFNIIGQLSEDEALILFHMKIIKNDPGTYFISKDQNTDKKILDHTIFENIDQPRKTSKHHIKTMHSPKFKKKLFPLHELIAIKYIDLYLSHLQSLNLVDLFNSPGLIEFFYCEEDAQKKKSQKKRIICYRLSSFGKLFVKACVPDKISNITNHSSGRQGASLRSAP